MRIVFHLQRDEAGVLTSKLDSPDQGVAGILVPETLFEDGVLTLSLPALAARFEGRLDGDGFLDGTWMQGGGSLPLRLERVDGVAPPNRPQEPKPPFPYEAEEVTFENEEDSIGLAGTLTRPSGTGPFPAVVLISGSGPQDRDESVFGHKPFLVLADHLTREGFAVLRFDDRGVGGSTGDFATATTLDFVRDVEAGVRFLRSRPDVGSKPLGLIGHSEGGIIAPLAAHEGLVDFVVLIAPPGVNGSEVILSQTVAILKGSGATEEEVAEAQALQERVLDIASGPLPIDRKRSELLSILQGVPGASPETVEGQVEQMLSPWMQFFLIHDPVPALTGLRVPVLAILGERDVQVLVDVNLEPLESALKASQARYEVRVLEGLNHLMQEAETGQVTEYVRIEQTMSPKALDVIADWMHRMTR